MRVWHLIDVKSLKLLTNASEEISANAAVISNDSNTFQAKIPENDYIKVKISKASITSTDVTSFLGKYNIYPIVPARSAVALVSESTLPSYKQGQRLFLSPYSTINNTTYKTHGVNIDGYLGDYAFVPTSQVFSLPEGVTDDEAVFIEDIALAINVLERLSVEKAEYIALYGASYINCIIAQLAIYYQTIPVMIDFDDERLNLASNCGVYYTINNTQENALQKIIEITSGKMVDHLVFDTDCFTTLDDLIPYVRSKGKVCLVGFNKYMPPIMCNMSRIVANQLQILGVNNGRTEISSAINMLANDIIKVDGFIENVIELEHFPDLMKKLSDKTNYLKNIVKC